MNAGVFIMPNFLKKFRVFDFLIYPAFLAGFLFNRNLSKISIKKPLLLEIVWSFII